MRLGYPKTMGTGDKNAYPFNHLFSEVAMVSPKDIIEGKVDALVIWGGEDISPSLYGRSTSERTHAKSEPSYRDRVEMELFHAAQTKGIPTIGICRGAQLVCALSGGELIQHVTGHQGDHSMITDQGKRIVTTSIHHQMMFPFGMPEDAYKLLAWTEEHRSNIYVLTDDDVRDQLSQPEPEIVYFRNTNSLAVQGHPEFDSFPSPFVQHVLSLTSKLMKGEL